MPYIKSPRDPIRALLKSYDITDGTKLSRILGLSPKTGRSRFNDTSTLTVGDLHAISRFAHIPIDEIRAAIK